MLKKKIYKLFLILLVSLSLCSGPLIQNEIRKMLDAVSGTGDVQVEELDEEPDDDEVPRTRIAGA